MTARQKRSRRRTCRRMAERASRPVAWNLTSAPDWHRRIMRRRHLAQATQFDTSETPRSRGGLPPAKSDPRRWWALAATSFGLFMALLDVTIVNVALPTIGDDLKASFADLQWVINAYALSLAVLLVTAGRLGDLFGRKRLFMLGLGLFALGSLICGLSGGVSIGGVSHIQVLIAARAFQGIGGGIML